MKIEIQEGKPVEVEDEDGVTQMGVVEKIKDGKIFVRLLLNDKVLVFNHVVEKVILP